MDQLSLSILSDVPLLVQDPHHGRENEHDDSWT